VDRRTFLRSSALAVGVGVLGPGFWRSAYAATAQPGVGPYGPLQAADANGVLLPKGFSSRILAVQGEPVGASGYAWHPAPDGGAVFPQPDGGWVYTSNAETAANAGGGAGALRFDARGEVVDAYRILSDTTQNCAGGPTPWGTWLSCEENPVGLVHECDVTGPGNGTPLPALGRFSHEAVAVDPGRGQLYLTEDMGDGRFYRFTPDAYPDLTNGALEALAATADGAVTWVPVLAPELPQGGPNRPAGSMVFDGGEGVWFDSDHVYFTTKGDNRVWDLDVAQQRLSVLYDAAELGEDAPLTGVDNIVVSQSGDIFVGEDGGNLEVVVITPDGVVAPVVRLTGHDASEITGPAFSPDGSRMYFSSQRGTDGRGVTFEVSGPFRTQRVGTVTGSMPIPGGSGGASDGDRPTGGDAGDVDGSPVQPASSTPTGSTGSATRAARLPDTGGSALLAGAAAATTAAAVAAARARRTPEEE
jgi:uncharacterized protein